MLTRIVKSSIFLRLVLLRKAVITLVLNFQLSEPHLQSQRIALVLSSHHWDEFFDFCDQIIIILSLQMLLKLDQTEFFGCRLTQRQSLITSATTKSR